MRNGGFLHGRRSYHHRRHAAERHSTHPGSQKQRAAAAGSGLLCNGTVRFLQVPHLADVDTSVELLQGAGCTARWQGSDITVQGRAFHLPPCAGSRRADAGIHFVLRTASGTAWPGGNGAARRVPHWCKAGGPAPFRPCADGRALPGGGGKADPDSACRTARCGHHTWVPQRGCYRDPASGSSCGAGRDGPARGCTRTGDQRSGSIPEPLRRLCTGAGTSTIRVQGRRMLYSCSFAPMADRIVASTLACACAAAGGRVELTGCRPETYAPLLEILAQMGCRIETGPESAVITRLGALHGAGRVFTGVYPALATDAAPLLAAAMLAADSASSIEDVVFERRFGCAEGFAAFGAAVQVQGRTLDIRPVRQLQARVHGLRTCAEARHWWWPRWRQGDGAALPTPVTSTADMPVLHRCWRNLVPKLSGKCRGKAPARKKHLQKSKIDLHSGQKDDTIQLYKCKQIISVRYAQFYDKIRWRTKLWHSCSMKKWTKTLRRSR